MICEIGLNHVGDEKYALEYANAFINSSAKGLTFQYLTPELYNDDKFSSFKLSDEFYEKVSEMFKANNKTFGLAILDANAISRVDSFCDFYKTISPDINNNELLTTILESTSKPLYVSTGMSDLKDIEEFTYKYEKYSDRIILVHTQLDYDIELVNLKVITLLKEQFPFEVAYGNHCKDLDVLYTAIGFEPESIFVYLKGRSDVVHPDDIHAIELVNLERMSKNIENLKLSLGSPQKTKMGNKIRQLYEEKSNSSS